MSETVLEARNASVAKREFLSGVLTAGQGKTTQSDRRLRAYLARVPEGGAAPAAFKYLAWNAALRGSYAQAAAHGAQFLARMPAGDTYERSAFHDELQFWRAFAGQPAMNVTVRHPVVQALRSNRSGRLETTLSVAGQPALAMIDTGAEQTVISSSLAKRLGLRLRPAILSDTGASGAVNLTHAALLPQLQLGGVAASNVPAEVLDDDQLVVGPPDARERLDMIVGYAVLRRAGPMAIRPGHRITFGAQASAKGVTAELLEEGFQPFLRARVYGEEVALLMDTGASATVLNRSFYVQNRNRLADLSAQPFTMRGIGGSAGAMSLRLPQLNLKIDGGKMRLTNVRVLVEPSQFDVPGTIGNLGRDAFGGYDSLTIDFQHHRVVLADPSRS